MGFAPDLSNVELEECCRKSIKEINQRITAGKWLQGVTLPLCAFSSFFGPSKGAGIATIESIRRTDWESLVQITMRVPDVVRNRVIQIAGIERLRHRKSNLNDFWTGIYEAFTYS